MKDWRRTIFVCLIACCGWSCTAVNQLNFLTPQDEVEIGKQAAREVEQSLPMYDDAVVVAYVDSVGQALVRASEFASGLLGVVYWEAGADAVDSGGNRIGQGFIELNWARTLPFQ